MHLRALNLPHAARACAPNRLRAHLVGAAAALPVAALLAFALHTSAYAQVREPSRAGESAASDAAILADSQAEAQAHFKRAKELYVGGSYQEARSELLLARKLDNTSKDLVFNLGIVAEKLQLFDEAMGYFRDYSAMTSVTDTERERAENIVRRIEGAKRSAPIAGGPTKVIVKTVEVPVERPSKGRFDALTATALGVGIAGFVGASVFGGLAMSKRPPSDGVVSSARNYEGLRTETNDAHQLAIYSDIALGVGIAGTVTALVLYFVRDRAPRATPPMTDTKGLKASAAQHGVAANEGVTANEGVAANEEPTASSGAGTISARVGSGAGTNSAQARPSALAQPSAPAPRSLQWSPFGLAGTF